MDSKLTKFVKGHNAFQQVKFKKNEERFKRLVEQGQNPKALFIGCSDSRVMPDMITGAKPGDLFIIRNVGNFVAPYKPDEDYHSTASAIEYAVSILEVSDIIVCGHSHCGAIEALYKELPHTPENLHTIKWLDLGREAKKVASLAYKDKDRTEMLRYTEKISVVYQLENLLTYPGVKRRIEEGTLFLHAWHYDLESGVIEHYDDENFEFIPLSKK
ncbi:carbonic anhydrase [Sulfurovum mangrovi]|uniref:carbonic anhydrase n=1 Tax=Sulfurovum mangrovi TaxID=2893889 RepID=UPI001E313774|nr:carbonic anhydrase [Sulfurovum mangrovi]UFH59587.1 carbonic anhydrase [Sulfurovum mangrovi]UFH60725.1 carbonic anhydrase [Sulfurovum mangrovi]